MPIEKVSVMLKPDGFFTRNPALDVPASAQSFNQSTLHQGADCCSHASGSGTDRAKLYKRVE
jgi:primary-amine oxidase